MTKCFKKNIYLRMFKNTHGETDVSLRNREQILSPGPCLVWYTGSLTETTVYCLGENVAKPILVFAQPGHFKSYHSASPIRVM